MTLVFIIRIHYINQIMLPFSAIKNMSPKAAASLCLTEGLALIPADLKYCWRILGKLHFFLPSEQQYIPCWLLDRNKIIFCFRMFTENQNKFMLRPFSFGWGGVGWVRFQSEKSLISLEISKEGKDASASPSNYF